MVDLKVEIRTIMRVNTCGRACEFSVKQTRFKLAFMIYYFKLKTGI